MKYIRIRTKDEIGILIEPTDNEELQKLKVGANDMIFSTWYGNNRNNIIKQADTIEELCDEFVYVGEKGNVVLGMSYKQFGDVKKYNVNGNKIYGAIWTDKGLIYVARMNEKGELELL